MISLENFYINSLNLILTFCSMNYYSMLVKFTLCHQNYILAKAEMVNLPGSDGTF